VQNLLEALLNSRIPIKEHHYKEVILSNKMQQTQKLTLHLRYLFAHKHTRLV
jgi:hypothetical protein